MVQEIEEAGIDRVDVSGTEVAQEIIDDVEGIWHVVTAFEVVDGEMLSRVGMREAKSARLHRSRERAPSGEHGGDGSDRAQKGTAGPSMHRPPIIPCGRGQARVGSGDSVAASGCGRCGARRRAFQWRRME
jgi:hypothetical protein